MGCYTSGAANVQNPMDVLAVTLKYFGISPDWENLKGGERKKRGECLILRNISKRRNGGGRQDLKEISKSALLLTLEKVKRGS